MIKNIKSINTMQFIRFSLVGILATLCHMVPLIILVEHYDYQPIAASTIGFVLAVIVSYILNYHYTFMATGNHILFFLKYLIVCIMGLGINTSIIFLTVSILKWWYIAGQIIESV